MPYLLYHLAILLYETAVHAIHHGSLILGVLQVVVECLGLCLCNTIIVVAGRGEHEVLSIGLVYALGHHCGVEDGREHFITQLGESLPLSQRKLRCIYRNQCLAEEFGSEAGLELVGAVVVMYTTREPYTLGVGHEVLPFLSLLVALEVGVYGLQHLADNEVVASVLVEQDVAALQRSLLEVVNKFLLVERERIESLHFVAEHLDVRKCLVGIAESSFFLLAFVA